MRVIDQLLISIGLRPDAGSIANFKSSIADTVKTIGGLTLAFKAVQAAVGGVVLGMAADMDELGDAAGRLGVDIAQLDKIKYIASQTDSSAEAAERSIEGLSKSIGDAKNGMKRAQETFKTLGISIKDSMGNVRPTVDVLYDVGDAMKKLSKSEQLSLGQKLQIDSTMITTITSDLSGLRTEYDLFSSAAQGDLAAVAQASSDLMDEIGKFKQFSLMLTRSVLSGFIVKMKEGFLNLRKWMLEHADAIKKAIQSILAFISRVSEVISSVFNRMGLVLSRIIDWWDSLEDSTKRVVMTILAVAAAWKYLNIAAWMNPIGLLVAAVGSLFLLWDDFLTYIEGGESYFDWGDWVPQITAVAEEIRGLWEELKSFASWVWDRLDFGFIWVALGKQIEGIREIFGGVARFIRSLFYDDTEGIADGFKMLMGGIIKSVEAFGILILGILSNVFKLLGDMIGVDLGPVVALVESIFRTIVSTAKSVIEPLADVVSGVCQTIVALFRGDLTGAIDALGKVFNGVFGTIKNIVLGVLDIIKDLVNFVLSGLGIDVTGVFNALKFITEAVFGAMKIAIDAVVGSLGWVVDKAKSAWEWLSKLWNGESPEDEKDRISRAAEKSGGKPNSDYLSNRYGSEIDSAVLSSQSNYPAYRVEKPPIITEATGSGGVVNNTTTDSKVVNNVTHTTNITVAGSGDPEDTAKRIEAKQNNVARYTVGALTATVPVTGGS